MMVRLGIFLVWLVHFLPLAWQNPLGQALGLAFYVLGRERRRVAEINIGLCFPELSPNERRRLVRRHFRAFGRSFLERGILWWSSADRIRRLVRMEGVEHWQGGGGPPQPRHPPQG